MERRREQEQKILDAAFEVFGTKGFYEAKMIEIAKKAEISKGTIYLYFPSKEKLYFAVNNRSFQTFLEQARQEADRCETFQTKLCSVARHHLSFFYETRHYPDSFWQTPHQMPEMMESLHRFFANYHTLIAELMEEEGLSDAVLHAKAFTGVLNGYRGDIMQNMLHESEIEQYVNFTVDLFLNGCS
ncbi:TetR/AcrR family transcriptional regulator [Metabacillus iocasae]|uniref:TetR/AcrR family fatty acid metabolism transcriptional regulator n=1 Tax=Priestia iocasae TaxID=2291674 RepID=A0ABS2QWT5_9BACI|nr:TetR/AcrR family transcriptional regulator [Metabacillus iocasae]MBM7703926.1 TetR/AcrR family fatty acid metabolism transcriptional regulator [Metabacillus iocasae]